MGCPNKKNAQRFARHPKITRSLAKMICDVRTFFEKERLGRSIPLNQVVDRTVAAKNVFKFIFNQVSSEKAINNFPEQVSIIRERNREVLDNFSVIIRRLIRAFMIKQKKHRTLYLLHYSLTENRYCKSLHLSDSLSWK